METKKNVEKSLENESTVEDELALLQIFPTEIWSIVCQARLSNVKFTMKISDSSPYFKKLIYPLRTKFLFPQVLKCMRQCLPVHVETNEFLLNLQSICTFWHKTVQHLVQEKILGFYNSENKWRSRAFVGRNLYTELRTEEEVISFQQHFQATHLNKNINPFPNRFLYIMYNAAERRPEHFQALQELFDRCGHQIHRLVVNVKNSEMDINFLKLQRILDVLPNLKFLAVWLTFADPASVRNTAIPPFATYKNLEYINVDGFYSGLVFDALLRNNRHVKSLRHLDCMREAPSHWLYSEPMSNLEDLGATFLVSRETQLLSSPTVNWPLKRLVFDVSVMEARSRTEEMQRCFDVLEQKFAATLTELNLRNIALHDSDHAHTLRLNLPCLASLVIDMEYPIPLDFILPLKSSLADLKITVVVPNAYVAENTILFFSVGNNLLSSNIWRLLPNLQQIAFRNGGVQSETTLFKATKLSRKTVPPFPAQ